MKNTLKKLFILTIGYPIYAISFLFIRRKNRWVFGSNNGFGCNAKYLFIKTIEEYPIIDAVWITRSKDTLKKMHSMGIRRSYYYLSIKGIYYLLTADKYITTHDLHRSLILWTIGRAKWVNLWHGVGIKSLRFKATTSPLSKIDRNPILKILLYPILIHLYYKPDLFLTTSPLMSKHFQKCFHLQENQLFLSDYPRCEPFEWKRDQLENFINKYEPKETQKLIETIKSFKYSYLYIPTWRKSKSQFGIDLNFNFKELNNLLKKLDSIFLIKLHPYTTKNTDSLKFSNIKIVPQDVDLYTILPYSSVLITDYSSIYYDYIKIPNKKVLLYPFDYQEFILNSRDLAFNYDTFTPGKKVYNFIELLSAIETNNISSTNDDDIVNIKELFWQSDEKSKELLRAIQDL